VAGRQGVQKALFVGFRGSRCRPTVAGFGLYDDSALTSRFRDLPLFADGASSMTHDMSLSRSSSRRNTTQNAETTLGTQAKRSPWRPPVHSQRVCTRLVPILLSSWRRFGRTAYFQRISSANQIRGGSMARSCYAFQRTRPHGAIRKRSRSGHTMRDVVRELKRFGRGDELD